MQQTQKRLREAVAASRLVRLHTSHSCTVVPSSLQERYNRGLSCVQLYSPSQCEVRRLSLTLAKAFLLASRCFSC